MSQQPSDDTGAGAPVPPVPGAPAAPPASGPRRVDPEDWAATGADDDDRYLRERPPHW